MNKFELGDKVTITNEYGDVYDITWQEEGVEWYSHEHKTSGLYKKGFYGFRSVVDRIRNGQWKMVTNSFEQRLAYYQTHIDALKERYEQDVSSLQAELDSLKQHVK